MLDIYNNGTGFVGSDSENGLFVGDDEKLTDTRDEFLSFTYLALGFSIVCEIAMLYAIPSTSSTFRKEALVGLNFSKSPEFDDKRNKKTVRYGIA